MSSKGLVQQDKKRRSLFVRKELSQINKKSFYYDTTIPLDLRINRQRFYLNQSLKNQYAVRIQNRCILSGRSSSVSKFFKLTRMKFKNLANDGLIPGIKKSSW